MLEWQDRLPVHCYFCPTGLLSLSTSRKPGSWGISEGVSRKQISQRQKTTCRLPLSLLSWSLIAFVLSHLTVFNHVKANLDAKERKLDFACWGGTAESQCRRDVGQEIVCGQTWNRECCSLPIVVRCIFAVFIIMYLCLPQDLRYSRYMLNYRAVPWILICFCLFVFRGNIFMIYDMYLFSSLFPSFL